MERERERQSYMRSKANDRDSDSELENAAAKRKGSRGKLAVSAGLCLAAIRIETFFKQQVLPIERQ